MLGQVGQQLLLQVDPRSVLGRDQHGVDAHRPAVFVDHRHLGLAVGAQVRHRADPPHLRQSLGEAVGQPDRQRHEIGRLVAGVAEHHPLVAGALGVERVLAAGSGAELEGRVHALRDIGRLGVERDQHAAGLPVEAVGVVVVADLAHGLAHDGRNVDVGRGGHLARHHDQTGGQERLAGHPAGRVPFQHGVEHGVGNLVRHLVRMALGH